MSEKERRPSAEEVQQATAEALAIVVGVMAEMSDVRLMLWHLRAAVDAHQKARPSDLRTQMLGRSLQSLCLKARNRYPDDEALQSEIARFLGTMTKH